MAEVNGIREVEDGLNQIIAQEPNPDPEREGNQNAINLGAAQIGQRREGDLAPEGVPIWGDGGVVQPGEGINVHVVGAAAQVIPQLPIEIQVMIAERVQGFRNLLNARVVSRGFNIGANRALRRSSSLWNSEFQDFEDFLTTTEGTRLSNEDQVLSFLRDTATTTTSPFPNGTLIFSPRNYRQVPEPQMPLHERHALIRFYNLFPVIVGRFGEFILNLVYAFQNSYVVNIMQLCGELGCILNLQNLRSLSVYRAETFKFDDNYDFDEERFREPATRHVLPITPLPALRELQIFGSTEDEHQIGVPSLIRSLCSSASNSCERLLFQLSDSYFVAQDAFYERRVPIAFPRLQKLKLSGRLLTEDQKMIFDNSIIPPGLNDIAVSLKLADFQEELDSEIINNLFVGIRELNLANVTNFQIHVKDTDYVRDENLELDDLLGNPYGAVTHLSIGQHSIDRWPNYLDILAQRFPHVRVLTVDVNARNNLTPTEFKNYCMRHFLTMGERLEVIRVPYYLWLIRRNGRIDGLNEGD